jgi:RHS repeat-associated protein
VNFQTTYTYDVLDDLASVIQGTSHNRTFVYDSLKRLTSSQNPETGTTPVLYTYDANGNVVTKTDARGTIINYSPTSNPIDQLNRVTSKTYSDGTPTVVYYYDGNAPSACSLGGFTYTNAIGRRTAMCDADGSEFWSYDPMGREKVEQRTTNSITKTTSYLYDFNGDLATLTYPSGRVMTYTTDSAGRPSEAQDIPNNIFYMQGTCSNGINSLGVCYAPQSAIASANIGPTGGSTWLKAAMTYNDRLQPNEIQYLNQAGNLMLLQYSFVDASSHNNGNVMAITNLVDDTRSQQFTYDQLNRLLTADTTSTYSTSPSHCWGEAYVYDNSTNTPGEFGNLTNINVPSTAYNGCTIESSLSLVANAANQITTFSYDASGNTLNDTHNSYTWYAESELKTAAGVTYTYDGDGNRLQKSNGKIYWYGAGTEVLDESDASGNITDEYVYFGGTRVSHRVASTNALYFYGADMLGTSRTIFTSAGVLCYDADFYPFGGERAYTNTCTQNYKFEGKERDTETNNDDFGARYYSSAFGRWTSPDWSAIPEPVPYANLANPQTLNLYGIARDNPETFAELDGHCIEDACVGEIFMLAVVTTTYLQSPQGQQNLNVVASGIAAAISSIFQRNGTGSSGGDTEGRRFTPDQRQQGKGEPCAYCGQKTTEEPGHPNSRETDHVNPKAQGGNTTPENTADACRTCNRQKGNRTPEQWKNGEKPPQPKPQQTQQPQEPQPPPVPQPTQQPPPNPPPPAPLTPDPIGP